MSSSLDTPGRKLRDEQIRLAMHDNPGQAKRRAIISQVLMESEALVQTQRNLLQHEVQRRMAEELFHNLDLQVQDNVDELTQQVNEVNIHAAELKRVVATCTPFSTPTRNRVLVSPSPSTPIRSPVLSPTRPVSPLSMPILTQAGTAVTPSRPPPGTTLREEDEDKASKGDPICPGSRSPAYVVYIGNEGKHGVFYAWSTHKDIIGAFTIYKPTCHTHVICSFSNRQLAHQFYDEFLDSGVAELLAENKPTQDERFIVVEGVAPAAYKNRKSLIMDGLQFRGGVVYRYIGSIEAARSQFNKYKAQGLTQCTHARRTTF
ncbi:hypothetical protein DFJ43DRAFT_1148698 [Lentinula guzmanii]|uniref:Uncharacterized protein n=1 Tax=Lentinula guzmanii TaxID=2804957 RepID=A0AA38JWB9_9AGAR|nr:hypothetical protein DFJ43DRAFT_1148698 [Lentinula guzmanii]